MIDLSVFKFDDAIAEALGQMDQNGDGVLSATEMKEADQSVIDKVQENCDTNSEWDLLRQVSLTRGSYKNLEGVTKGMAAGKGGRFKLMVDRLMTAGGYSQSSAKAIAVAIGKRFGKIPS